MKKLLIAFLLLPTIALAQTAKEYIDRGDNILNDKKILNDDKRHEDAIALYTKAIITDPAYIEAYRKRVNAMRYVLLFKNQLHSREVLIADYSSIIKLNPTDIDAYQKRATEKSNVKDVKGSMEDYEKLINIDPGNKQRYYSEIGDLYMSVFDFINAEKNYTLTISPGKGNYSGRSRVRSLIGNYQGALDDWIELIKLRKPQNYDFLKLGELYAKLGDYKAAIENYTKAIILMDTRIKEGTLYESEFKVINPYEERAKVKILAGDYKSAMDDYNVAIKYNPMPILYNERAELKNKMGDKVEACMDWNIAYAKATKTLKEWRADDSIRYIHRNDRVQVVNSSNQDTTIDTLGISSIILNIKKYCE